MLNLTTIQANRDLTGVFSSANSTITGIGVGIYVGVAGDVSILTRGGDTAVYTAVPQGTFMQVPLFKQVLAAGTTSTNLSIAYYDPQKAS